MKAILLVSSFLLYAIILQAQCDFTISNAQPCAGDFVTFTITNPDGSIYSWDFDGDTEPDAFGINVGYGFPISFNDEVYTIALYDDDIFCEDLVINVLAAPDASIGVVPGGDAVMNGNNITACNESAEVTLVLFNNSQTCANNTLYEFDWGDGTAPETFTNATFPCDGTITISHPYSGFGYKTISVTVTSINGCVRTQNFTFYSGGNPSIALGNPGNTIGLCAPATIAFPISDFEDNPAGTEYFIYVNDVLVASFNQDNVPSIYEHMFASTSCGESTADGLYDNAFDIRIDATNPCGSTTGVVEPIEVSTLPQASFIIDEPANGCPEEVWTFTDNSTGVNEVVGNPAECINELLPNWTISPNLPGVAWNLISGSLFGSSEISVEFLLPGTYTIEMTLNSQACGPSIVTETIFVSEPPTADAEIIDGMTDGCTPQTLTFNNLSEGLLVTYEWTILPATGWIFINGTNENSENPTIQFIAAGTYVITLTTSNVCDEDTWTTTVEYASSPFVSIDPIPDECQVATLDFTISNVFYVSNGEPITAYIWNFPGGTPASSSEQYPIGIQYNTPGQHIVTCTITNACGAFIIADTFYIEEPVALSLPENMTFCEGDPSFTLSAIPTGGIWSGPGVINDSIFDPSLAMSSNTLTYTYGDCVSTGTIMINVNELPEIDISNNITSACVSVESVTLTALPIPGSWVSPNGGVVNGNVFSPAQSGAGNYTLIYTYVDPLTECEESDQFSFEVFDLPEIIVSDTSYCDSPGLVSLPIVSPAGGTWSGPGVIGDQFDPQGSDVQMNNVLTYSYTNGNTFCENSATINVSVIPLGELEVTNEYTFCAESLAFDLNTLVDPPGGNWDANGSAGLNGNVFNPEEAGPGLHILSYSIGEGNCMLGDDVMIQVNSLPVVEINNSESSACISVEAVPLIASPIGGEWSSNNSGILIDGVFYPESSGVGAYTLTYFYTDSITNCSGEQQMLFTVNPLPVVESNDTTYCNNPGLVNLPYATPSGGTWTGSGVVGNQFNPMLVGVNIVDLTYTFSDGDNCTDSIMIMVEVIAPVAIDAGPDTILCSNQGSYPLGGIPSGIGTWSGPGVVDNVFYPDQVTDGIHVLYYSIGGGNCFVQDFIEVEVIHETVNAGPDVDVCITDGDYSLEGSNTPVGGTWSGSGVTGGIFDPMLAGIGMHEIIYTYVEPVLDCTFEATRIITVHDLANSDFSFEPDSSCVGVEVAFFNLSDNMDNPYWSFGDGNFSTEINPIHIYSDPGIYEVLLINTTGFQCVDSISQTISIDEVPTPSFDIELIPTCEGVFAVLTNPDIDGDSYILDYTLGTSINEWVDTIFFEGQEDTIIYNISLTSTNYCGPGTFNADPIIVPPIFNAAFGVIPLNNQDNVFCSPFEASFADISTGEIDSLFFFYGTGDSSINIIDDYTYINTTDSIITFTATLIIYGGNCIPDTAQVEISLLPVNFTAAFNVSDTTICENEVLMLNDFTTPTTLIQYYELDMGNGDTITIDPDNVDDFEYIFPNTGTFVVTLTASDGCTESSYSVPITVLAIPEVSLNIQDEGCTGEEIIIVAGLSDSLLAVTLNINNDTILYSVESRYIFDDPGEYPITLTVTNLVSGCATTVSKDILIRENIGLPLLVSETINCDMLEVEIMSDNVDYIIWGDGSFDSPETGASSISHQYQESGYYFVELFNTDSFGCEYKETYNVEIFENDLIVDTYPDTLIDLGETATLGANISGTGPFSYVWSPDSLLLFPDNLITETNQLVNNTVFTIDVVNQFGCRAIDNMIVRLKNQMSIYIPNAFSPNGDLINDVFMVYTGPEIENILELKVFDRWGEQVFEKLDFPPNMESEGWDGYLEGKVMNPQVFVYYVKVEYINGDEQLFKGSVTLVK